MTTYGPRCSVHPDRIGPFKTLGPSRLFVLHTSEGLEGDSAAEALCSFLGLPGDRESPSRPGQFYGASYHYLLDTDRVLPAVREEYVAYAAAGANADGVHACFPGKASQTRAQWLDLTSSRMIRQCADLMLERLPSLGIPFQRLNYLQVRLGLWGYCDHYTINQAYGLTDHTDCGPNFPWDVLSGMLTPPTQEAPPMATLKTPIRVLDTRATGGPLVAGTARRVGILPDPPAWAGAVVVNITAVDGTAFGWLSIDGGKSSKVNYSPRQAVANEVSVPLKNDGVGWYIEVTALNQVNIVVDVAGFDSVI
jgi:hypothetical protein